MWPPENHLGSISHNPDWLHKFNLRRFLVTVCLLMSSSRPALCIDWPASGSLGISGSSPVFGVSIFGGTGSNGMDVLGQCEARKQHILCHVVEDSLWRSGLFLHNPDPTNSAIVTLKLFEAHGLFGEAVIVTVPPGGKVCHFLDRFFAGFAPGQGWVEVQSDRDVFCGHLFMRRDSGDFAIIEGAALTQTVCFSHIQSDSVWRTYLYLVNSGDSPENVILTLLDDEGRVVSQGVKRLAAKSRLSGSIDLLLGLSSASGWLLVESEDGGQEIASQIVYAKSNRYLASHSGTAPEGQDRYACFFSDSDWKTSLSLCNPSQTQTANITLSVHSSDGTFLNDHELVLPPRSKTIAKLSEMGLGKHSQGWIRIASNQPTGCTAFIWTEDPLVEARGLAAYVPKPAANNISYPHYTLNSHWWTWLWVGNPGTETLALEQDVRSVEGVSQSSTLELPSNMGHLFTAAFSVVSESQVRLAVKKALDYLYRKQLPWGEFSSYFSFDYYMAPELSVYHSSNFFTTFIVYSVKFLNSPKAHEIEQLALSLFVGEMLDPAVWHYYTSRDPSYSSSTPEFDTTSCVGFLLDAAGIEYPSNLAVYDAFRTEEGLYWTVMSLDPGVYNDIDCVIQAQVLFYLRECPRTSAICGYLLGLIDQGTEIEHSTYYIDLPIHYYVYSRAYSSGMECLAPMRETLIQRILAQKLPDGSSGNPLFTALNAAALQNLNYQGGEIDEAVSYLVNQQRIDGSWPSMCFFVLPKGVIPWGPWHYGSDELTTGFALEALARWLPNTE